MTIHNTLCNVCNSGNYEDALEKKVINSNVRKFQNEKYTVWRCSSCNSLNCLEEIDYDYYYKYYPTIKEHELDIWTRAAYGNWCQRLVEQGLSVNDDIIDFGCGKGLFVKYLKEKKYSKAVGYDRFVEEYRDESLLGKTYDFVISQDVIEHVENPKQLLKQLVDLLRPNGMLCLGTPNADSIDLSKPEEYALSLDQPYHRHILSEKAIRQLGTEYGLSVIKVYHRWYYDTWFPTVNDRFLKTYIFKAGNLLDVAFEPPHVKLVLSSPKLWFYALFGHFFSQKTEMMVLFRKVR